MARLERSEKTESEDCHSLVLHPHEVSAIAVRMALLIQSARQGLR